MSHKEKPYFGIGNTYVLVLLFRSVGLPVSVNQPQDALLHGALGYVIMYYLIYIFIGIPIVYMELIIGQFTSRDCIDVWKIRKCVSHVGYFVVFWQIITFVYNHLAITFAMHYLLISFESPGPFYVCGWWSTNACDVLSHNYTLNKYCLRAKRLEIDICSELYVTMPEYQYFRYNILGKWNYLGISWRLSLASVLLCIVIFINTFRRINSLKWFLYPFSLYPILGYIVLTIGSLRQKGLLSKFEDAIDFSFNIFLKELQFTRIITQVTYSLGAGSGVILNLASSASFRLPCFTTTVVVVLVAASFNLLTTFTSAMMTCPYSMEYGISPRTVVLLPLSFTFEMIPVLLSEYEHRSFWLILVYSCQTLLGLTTSIIIIFSLSEMIIKRNFKISKYPALVSLLWVIFVFFTTLPILGYIGYTVVMRAFAYIHLVSIFFVMIECSVFMVWYGFDRFYQDVHFMLGRPPKTYIKICWMFSTLIMALALCQDIRISVISEGDNNDILGTSTFGIIIGVLILITIARLVTAAIKGNYKEIVRLDPRWGPKSDLLLRSRAMFTAHAMTKEYIYRQYHLQAGIATREKKANIRIQRKSPF